MDTFAALALATDPPTPSILNRKPEPKSAPLISLTMWKMIIGQSIYQLVVTLILYFGGKSILSYSTTQEIDQLQTLIFNTFVWMQIFNQWNSRRLDNRFNIFEGMQRNYFFIGIQFIIIAGQIMIIFVGGAAFSVRTLNGAQWGYSIVLGILSLPIGVIIRLIPDELIAKFVPHFMSRKSTPDVVISDEEAQYQWNPALVEIKEELAFLKKLRGGRLNVLKYRLQHPRDFLPRSRSGSRSQNSSMPQTPTNEPSNNLGDSGSLAPAPPTPERRSIGRRSRSRSNSAFGPAAAMAGVIAGSIAGWSPLERREGDSSFTQLPSLDDRAGLEQNPGVEIHPETKPDDPVIAPARTASQGSKAPPSQVPELTPTPAPTSSSTNPSASTSTFGALLPTPSPMRNERESPGHKPHASA